MEVGVREAAAEVKLAAAVLAGEEWMGGGLVDLSNVCKESMLHLP